MDEVKQNFKIWHQTKEFFQHWGNYILLILTMNIFFTWIAIPIFQWLITQCMRLGKIPYLSNDNLLQVLFHYPIPALGLFLIVILILFTLLVQFTFMIYGIAMIREHGTLQPLSLLKISILKLRKINFQTFLYFVIYMVAILPFSNFIFRSNLLSKVTIPKFIFESIGEKPLLGVGIAALYLIVGYLGLRLIFFLPKVILEDQPANQAVKASFQLSKHHIIREFLKVVLLNALTVILNTLTIFILYLIQTQFDKLGGDTALLLGAVSLSLLELIAALVAIWAQVIFFLMILPTEIHLPAFEKHQSHRILRRITASGLILVIGFVFYAGNISLMSQMTKSFPLQISHRGVNGKNGVQNTIPAMADTIKSHPDYIEMDIRETKDNQFVVMHDANLKELAGVNKAPHDLTLAELTKLTVHENGHTAKIPSFDEYLAYADAHHQKLLIEIKTSPKDSKDMLQRFNAKYKADIMKNQHQIHSLSYPVVTGLKSITPNYFVSFILPFDLTYPSTDADAYTMEQTTLDDNFIVQAHNQNKKVYAWTVDDQQDMEKMIFKDVDAIITDNLSDLQDEISNFKENKSYADRLLLYFPQLMPNNEVEN